MYHLGRGGTVLVEVIFLLVQPEFWEMVKWAALEEKGPPTHTPQAATCGNISCFNSKTWSKLYCEP